MKSIDDLYEGFRTIFQRDVEAACGDLREERKHWNEQAPGTLRADDCFLDGPIANARSWRLGGVKYVIPMFPICSLATTADCFTPRRRVEPVSPCETEKTDVHPV